MYRDLVDKGQIVDDSPYAAVLQRVGRRIAAAAGKQWYTERFYVVRGNQINAFSAPGGLVFVNEGLLRGVDNVDELANVLGHETGHIVLGHVHARNNVQQQETFAKRIGGLFVHTTHAKNTYDIATGAANYAFLNFSRQQELAADEYGADLAAKAGYNPWGSVWFFQEVERVDGDAGYEKYLQHHPSTSDRIAKIETHFRAQPRRFAHFGAMPPSTAGLPTTERSPTSRRRS